MEFALNLLEDEEVACAVHGHAEILAEEAEKLEFAVYLSGLSEFQISINPNIQVLYAGISQVMYLGM